jgi:hypothetical protein
MLLVGEPEKDGGRGSEGWVGWRGIERRRVFEAPVALARGSVRTAFPPPLPSREGLWAFRSFGSRALIAPSGTLSTLSRIDRLRQGNRGCWQALQTIDPEDRGDWRRALDPSGRIQSCQAWQFKDGTTLRGVDRICRTVYFVHILVQEEEPWSKPYPCRKLGRRSPNW